MMTSSGFTKLSVTIFFPPNLDFFLFGYSKPYSSLLIPAILNNNSNISKYLIQTWWWKLYIYIYIYIYHVVLIAQISLSLSHHLSLSSITFGWSSRLHPVSVQSCCKFFLITQHLHVCVKGSIGKRCLWVYPYFSSCVPHILFVLFGCFYWCKVNVHTASVLWDVASRICSI